MNFFKYTGPKVGDQLSYEESIKSRFILYYGLIGFISTAVLFFYLLSIERDNSQNIFMLASIFTNPILGLTALLAWKNKAIPSSITAIGSLAMGSYAALVLDFPAYLSLMIVLLFSANFISIGSRLLYYTFFLLISSMSIKLSIESGIIQLFDITQSNLSTSSIVIILILMFSVFSYALFINLLINSGMRNSEKLIDTSKKLREALSIKERFIALIAHDLKGPVGSITNFLHGIKEGHIPIDHEIIDLLKDTSSKTQHLLVNLLDWSVAQNNGYPLRMSNFNLLTAIKQETELLNIAAVSKALNLEVECQEGVEVYADYTMVCTAIRNLLSNAIKFSKHGDSIRIYCEHSGSHAKVKVIDQGVGMTTETMDKLFQQKYFNDSQFGTEKEKGTGLGLIITNDFIRANQGEIGVESQKGVGSVFWFTLPLREDVQIEKPQVGNNNKKPDLLNEPGSISE